VFDLIWVLDMYLQSSRFVYVENTGEWLIRPEQTWKFYSSRYVGVGVVTDLL
jgi:hypothetical protein